MKYRSGTCLVKADSWAWASSGSPEPVARISLGLNIDVYSSNVEKHEGAEINLNPALPKFGERLAKGRIATVICQHHGRGSWRASVRRERELGRTGVKSSADGHCGLTGEVMCHPVVMLMKY
jgi:hypothetical protein